MFKKLLEMISNIFKGESCKCLKQKEDESKILNSTPKEEILEQEKKLVVEEKIVEEKVECKKGKYEAFEKFLQDELKEEYILKYEEIEKIIGTKLPDCAYKHRAWMSNSDTHPLPKIWLKYGYESEEVKVGESIILRKKI